MPEQQQYYPRLPKMSDWFFSAILVAGGILTFLGAVPVATGSTGTVQWSIYRWLVAIGSVLITIGLHLGLFYLGCVAFGKLRPHARSAVTYDLDPDQSVCSANSVH